MVKTKTKIEEEIQAIFNSDKPWVTIVWDDPVILMTYVTYVFMELFGYSKERATELMLKVHNDGKAIVSTGSREEMEHDVARLHELGLADQQDLLDSLPLDSVVEVFNLVGLSHLNERSAREFCYRFPGILAYDADLDEYRRPESSREIEKWYAETSYYDDIRVVLFEDMHGLRAVEWENQLNLSYYMLRRDFESAN